MPKFPKLSLEEKLVWMRERQKEKELREKDREARAKAVAEQAARLPETNGALGVERLSRKMLRVDEVAQLLGVSTKSVQRWFRDRAVLVRGPGLRRTTMLISGQILDDWIAEHTVQPRPQRKARG